MSKLTDGQAILLLRDIADTETTRLASLPPLSAAGIKGETFRDRAAACERGAAAIEVVDAVLATACPADGYNDFVLVPKFVIEQARAALSAGERKER
jgi:hypothetical protein